VTERNPGTIVALATPIGVGGIAVIRVSGPLSLHVASKISGLPKKKFRSRFAQFSSVCNSGGSEIDRGILTFFKGPNSYTGEDVLEISSHGGVVIPERIIDACLSFGCLPAEPGEFTRRAFLNGKMDLAQAEAVADVIAANSRLSQKISYRMLSGKFSDFVHNMKSSLMNVVSLVEASLDFTENEILPVPNNDLMDSLDFIIESGNSLLHTYTTGRLLKHGAIVSIIGFPNVGKSSILNALISEERAIVNEIPGTTRDVIEVIYQINGFPFRFIDTAGLRSTKHPIEQRGIEFSQKYIAQSDLVIWVFDINQSTPFILKEIQRPFFEAPFLLVLNKTDLMEDSDDSLKPFFQKGINIISVSALKNWGFDVLIQKILSSLFSTQLTDHEVILTNSRHKNAIHETLSCLNKAKDLLSIDSEQALVAFELRDALSHLDKILGITTADDILDNIFSTFCIGK